MTGADSQCCFSRNWELSPTTARLLHIVQTRTPRISTYPNAP